MRPRPPSWREFLAPPPAEAPRAKPSEPTEPPAEAPGAAGFVSFVSSVPDGAQQHGRATVPPGEPPAPAAGPELPPSADPRPAAVAASFPGRAAAVWAALLGGRALSLGEVATGAGLSPEAARGALAALLDSGRVATDPAALSYRIRAERGWCPGCGDGPGGGGRLVYCSRCRWTASDVRALWEVRAEE
jgi:hypothetical protein